MQVPYSKSSRLLFDYTLDRHATGDIDNPYALDNERPQTEYGHLLNFFESGDNASNFQRIFDYLHTPSPFAGAYTYLNPLMFSFIFFKKLKFSISISWIIKISIPIIPRR